MEKDRNFIIAVDGPGGAGKSTICRQVCKELGFLYVNTGGIYRAIGTIASKEGIDLSDEIKLCELVEKFSKYSNWDQNGELYYKGKNIESELYSEFAGKCASKIAKLPKLREALLPMQRNLANFNAPGALLDGRDIGTVVFPDADLKIYMTASIDQRVKRRLNQLRQNNVGATTISPEEIRAQLEERDFRDQTREIAPLQKTSDAIEFDTSHYSLEDSINEMIKMIKKNSRYRNLNKMKHQEDLTQLSY